jgi:uncharacterized protein YceK
MRIGVLAVLLTLSSCGTLIDLGHEQRVYGGVRYDMENLGGGLGHSFVPAWIRIFDVPFSLVLDTVVLPLTVIQSMAGAEPRE